MKSVWDSWNSVTGERQKTVKRGLHLAGERAIMCVRYIRDDPKRQQEEKNMSNAMHGTTANRTRKLVGTAILVALVIILQFVSSFIKVGAFSITLVLLPIIVGAVIYGRTTGVILGFVFAVITLINAITGADAGGYILISSNPVATVAVVLLKSIGAGWCAAVVSRLFEKRNLYLGVVLAAVVCPVFNTGVFSIAMLTLFRDTLASWAEAAGHSNMIVYVLVGLVGVNFLIELLVNVVLSPVIVRIIRAGRRMQA